VPLSLAVGFAMISSYLLSSTRVPVLSVWLLRGHESQVSHGTHLETRLARAFGGSVSWLTRLRWLLVPAYLGVAGAVLALGWWGLGREIFPKVDLGQFTLRLRAPTGTRIEQTEDMVKESLAVIKREAGPEHVAITQGYIGVVPPARLEELRLSFEPADIVNEVMSFGSPTPIEIVVSGAKMADHRAYAEKVRAELEQAKRQEETAAASVAAAAARLEVAQAGAGRAEEMVKYLQVKAPNPGVVTKRQVNTGDLLRPQSGPESRALFVVARKNKARAVLEVPESDASLIRKDAPVTLRIQGERRQRVAAVSRTSWALDLSLRRRQGAAHSGPGRVQRRQAHRGLPQAEARRQGRRVGRSLGGRRARLRPARQPDRRAGADDPDPPALNSPRCGGALQNHPPVIGRVWPVM
jgi:biotin carboxyl carrier protein